MISSSKMPERFRDECLSHMEAALLRALEAAGEADNEMTNVLQKWVSECEGNSTI